MKKAEIEITKEPEDVTVYVGENATFETDAEGTGTLRYQWYKNNKNSSIGGTAIKNANQKTYTEVNAQKTEYNYFYCEVKSSSNGKKKQQQKQE